MKVSPAFAVAVASCCALGTWAGISAASAQPTSERRSAPGQQRETGRA